MSEATLMFDPYDTQAIAEAIGIVLLDQNLRRTLCAKGSEQASRFSWAETAKRTLCVYQDVVGGNICST